MTNDLSLPLSNWFSLLSSMTSIAFIKTRIFAFKYFIDQCLTYPNSPRHNSIQFCLLNPWIQYYCQNSFQCLRLYITKIRLFFTNSWYAAQAYEHSWPSLTVHAHHKCCIYNQHAHDYTTNERPPSAVHTQKFFVMGPCMIRFFLFSLTAGSAQVALPQLRVRHPDRPVVAPLTH